MVMGRPPLFTDVEELDGLIEEYFESPEVKFTHKETGQIINRPTMSGLAIALGMDRKSLYNYSKKEDFFPTINKARARVEQALEQNLYSNAVAGTIFNLKNNFDWVDKHENDVTTGMTVVIS